MCVCGYHIYKTIWMAAGERYFSVRESHSTHPMHPLQLSEGLSQATLVMTGARPGGTGTIPSIAAIRRHSKLCYLFYYNATSN